MKAVTCHAKDPDNCRFHGTGKHSPENVALAKAVAAHKKTAISGGRSDTSVSETHFIDALMALNTNSEEELNQACQKLHDLPNEQKFSVIRDSSVEEIKGIVSSLRKKITQELETDTLSLSSIKNNRIGSDLEEATTNTSIELKFGAATDLNVGMAAFHKLIPAKATGLLPSATDKEKWRLMYAIGNKDAQFKEYVTKMKAVHNSLDAHGAHPLDAEGQHVLNCFYQGITSGDEINRLYNSPSALKRKIVRLNIKPDGTWNRFSRPPLEDLSGWEFESSEFTEANRLNIYYKNKNGYRLRLTYNHKNNYVFKNGMKAPAKNALGGASINGWFMSPKEA